MAFISPILATKLNNPQPAVFHLGAVAAVEYLAMILAPRSPGLISAFITGIDGAGFHLPMTPFNLRTGPPSGLRRDGMGVATPSLGFLGEGCTVEKQSSGET
jgi:cyanate permease